MTTEYLAVKHLALDLENYRTVKQSNETGAIHALIAIDTDWFWALTESLLVDGYLPTENIVVIKTGKKYVVKEGNRRVAALKLLHGLVARKHFSVPQKIKTELAKVEKSWQKNNEVVPCAVYQVSESEDVDRIVALTHGKGELAGRAKWKAIARARHNRDEKNQSEPALDLLEKYLKHGKNITDKQKEQWAGDYSITVLEEAIRKIAPRINCTSVLDLVDTYPNSTSYRAEIELLIHDVGTNTLDFKSIRDTNSDFAQVYKLPTIDSRASGASTESKKQNVTAPPKKSSPKSSNRKVTAHSLDDPRSVIKAIKKFKPKGNNREKVVTLMNEMSRLKIPVHPLSFCFLLRSALEISAKAYATDHSEVKISKNGQDRKLVEILKDVTSHLTSNNSDKDKTKVLHGALTQLSKADGILSVTSMNQLVHNPKFSVTSGDICTLFSTVFPLLEEMNQ